MDARLSHTLAFVGGIVLTVVGLEAGRFGHWLLLSPKGPQVASALSEESPKATKADRLAIKKNALTRRNLDERVKAGPGKAAEEAGPEDREGRREKRREAMKGLLEGLEGMEPDQRREAIGQRLKAMGGDDKMLERMRTRAKARRERGEGEAEGKGGRLRDKAGRRGKGAKAPAGEAEVPALVDTGTPPEPGTE